VSGPAYRASPGGKSRRLIVEILGPPGAGKTSLARTLSSSCNDVQLVSTYWLRNLIPRARSAASLQSLLLSDSFSVQSPMRERAWTVRISATHAIVERAFKRTHVVLLDQGPLYAMLRLMDEADARPRGARWLRWREQELSLWAAALDIAVVLDAPDDVLLKRIRARSKSHVLKDRPDKDASEALARWRALIEDLITEIHAHGNVEIHRINTDDKPSVEVATGAMRALGFEIAPTPANHRARSTGSSRRPR
jgi:adenylate kinase family enzyme